MKKNLMDKFIESTNNILGQFLGETLTNVNITELKENIAVSVNEVNIDVGYSGTFKGKFIISVSQSMAKQIVSAMMGGMPVDSFDEITCSAISECTNMIAGNACTMLTTDNIHLDITPPTLSYGEHNTLFSDEKFYKIDLFSNLYNEQVSLYLIIK